MNHPDFSKLRRVVDEAITFNDLASARSLADEGLRQGMQKECPGEVMYFKAQLAVIDERYEEALVYLDKALTFNPNDGAAYNDIALCMLELGRIDGVMELFDKGIAVEPDYATIHHNKGWFLNKIGQSEAALNCFAQALDLEPGRAVTFENMADAYESLGRMTEALASYKQALLYTKESFVQVRQQISEEIERLGYA